MHHSKRKNLSIKQSRMDCLREISLETQPETGHLKWQAFAIHQGMPERSRALAFSKVKSRRPKCHTREREVRIQITRPGMWLSDQVHVLHWVPTPALQDPHQDSSYSSRQTRKLCSMKHVSHGEGRIQLALKPLKLQGAPSLGKSSCDQLKL